MVYEQVLQGVWHTNKKCAVFKVKVRNKIKTHLILYTGRSKQKGYINRGSQITHLKKIKIWHTNKKCAVFKVKVRNKIKTHLRLYTYRRKQRGWLN